MLPLPPQYGDFAEDPFTGLMIPKTMAGNLEWRQKLLREAATSASMRRTIKQASASSPIFWMNAFAWTFLQKEPDAFGKERSVMGEASHVPFITWKVQDEALVELHDAITNGIQVGIRKSRDMGASWIVVGIFQWFWQFRPSTTFLEISRKEALVDKRGDMDSLFQKHRYLLQWQPEFLRPQRIKDYKLHLENLENGSSIEGESTNESAGQASRKTAILLDEFARVPNGAEIDVATADTAACRIFLSTPQGPNTGYANIMKEMRAGRRAGKIIEMLWYRHPKKLAGLAEHTGEDKQDHPYTSLWLQNEHTRRSRKNIAMNIWAEDGASGDLFFDMVEIEKHRTTHATPALLEGVLTYDEDMGEEAKKQIVKQRNFRAMRFTEDGARRPWKLWIPLIDLRPNQFTRYVLAVDIAGGSGASNSVISVLDHSTNMKVAEFADSYTSPEQLADIVAFASVWFGGSRPPAIIFEKNGPGMVFGKRLVDTLNPPGIYYQTIEDEKSKGKTRKWGWHSNPSRKEMLLGQYRDALKTNLIINPSDTSLDECLNYIYDETGRIDPGLTSEDGGGNATHGDRVIADALLVLGRHGLPKMEPEGEVRAPHGTFAERKLKSDVKRKSREEAAAWND
jgi:hypothetical protein